jgi:hypothetical protein
VTPNDPEGGVSQRRFGYYYYASTPPPLFWDGKFGKVLWWFTAPPIQRLLHTCAKNVNEAFIKICEENLSFSTR